MDEFRNSTVRTAQVGIRPRHVYGLRTDVIGNIQFTLNDEVIYPVEGVLAIHDYVQNIQGFLRLAEDTTPEAIAMSPTHELLAVYERKAKSGCFISIFELETLKKRRSLELPANYKYNAVKQMLFTNDSRGILLLTKPPDEMIFLLIIDKTYSVFEGRATIPSTHSSAECVACHISNSSIIAIGGLNSLLIMSKSERGFTVNNNIKCNFRIISMTYISSDLLMLGTSDDQLILVENGDIKLRQKASEAETIDLLNEQDQIQFENETQNTRYAFQTKAKVIDNRVVCLTTFKTGFAYAMFNRVIVFERVSKQKFERRTILTVPITIHRESSYQIQNIAIDKREETVIVTTLHAQIYVGILIVPESLKTKNLKFEPLGVMLHSGEIIDMSVCIWKPIIMTASRDQTIRIWNYETDKIELVRKFQVDVNTVELSSTGLMAAVGFSDQLRIAQIFMDELNIVKTYNFPQCKTLRYSNFGHLLAVACGNNIIITSTYNLEIIIQLEGHTGLVLSVYWDKTDKYLVSGGADGAIYQWEIETGERVQEIVQSGIEFVSVAVPTSEPLIIYAATQLGMVREFQDSKMVRELSISSKSKGRLTDLCLSLSDLIMFVADDEGHLFNIPLPLEKECNGLCTNFRFFVGQVNKLRFSVDDTMLIAISNSGTLGIWTLENVKGKVAKIDSDLLKSQEVLVPRHQLQDKNKQIAYLEMRLKQQADDFQYQLSQNEISDGQQLAEVHRSYCQALEELKELNSQIESSHSVELEQVIVQINELKEDHRKQIENVLNQNSERMIVEYQKFANLRESMLELRESYENKLKNSAGTLDDTVDALDLDYSQQLAERRELIHDLMKYMDQKKTDFVEYCQEVEEENDRKIVEMQTKYEAKLTEERNETQVWRAKSIVLQKRYENLNREYDNLLEEVAVQKEEHSKYQVNIDRLARQIEELKRDISDRDNAITSKEKRIQDLLQKNQDLEKYKKVLNHKISELKAMIGPREFQISDKRKHIQEMEVELNGLTQNKLQLKLQLREMEDKFLSNSVELKNERRLIRAARECVHQMCTDIYHVGQKIDSPNDLKVAVTELFHKNANDDILKNFVSLDPMVSDEYLRQRVHIETVRATYKNRSEDKTVQKKYKKLCQEHDLLSEEAKKLYEENKTLRGRLTEEDLKKFELSYRK